MSKPTRTWVLYDRELGGLLGCLLTALINWFACGEMGMEQHCIHFSGLRNDARKKGRRDRRALFSVFSLLLASSHVRVKRTTSVRELHVDPAHHLASL
jgi:hypothetical protein